METEHAVVREAVGAFRSSESLESAVSALASAGWDKAEMSLLAQDSAFDPGIPARGHDMRQAADEADAPRSVVLVEEDLRQGRTLATSMAAAIAAFAASGATILTGGGALAAAVGAAAAGSGAAAAVNVIGRWLGDNRAHFLNEQIDQGGILLWVTVHDADQARSASEILRRYGASNVHVHEISAV